MWRSLSVVLALVASVVVVPAAVGGVSAALAQPTGSTYTALTPSRVLDTRQGVAGPVGSGQVVTLDLGGRLPAEVTAVVLNVTGVGPSAATFVTVYPHGAARPNVSNLNLVSGEIRANLVTVTVGVDGAVELYNNAGSVHLLADLAGYYSTGDGTRFTPRVADRTHSVSLGGQGTATLDLSRWVPVSATAVVVNVTATRASTGTYVTAWPYRAPHPGTSTVNLAQGATNANLTVVKLGSGRRLSLYNNAGAVDVFVDIAGFYSPEFGAVFTPVTPKRGVRHSQRHRHRHRHLNSPTPMPTTTTVTCTSSGISLATSGSRVSPARTTASTPGATTAAGRASVPPPARSAHPSR